MFTSPETVAAEVAYRRERIVAAYQPAAHRRPYRDRQWRLPFTGRAVRRAGRRPVGARKVA